MKQTSIGGYFELELADCRPMHESALALNSARHCLEYIIKAKNYKKIFLPAYTCNVLLDILARAKVDVEFYSITERMVPVRYPELRKGEAFLYTNYFGLAQGCVDSLVSVYGESLIVDNAQAFYAPPPTNVDTFYSPRKFFGVPDGGYLYTNKILSDTLPQDISFNRVSHLLSRIDLGAEYGYSLFRKNSEEIAESPLMRMSNLTSRLLSSIDYEAIKERRQNNFRIIHEALGECNDYIFSHESTDVPMIYPFLCHDSTLKRRLIEEKIYIATYWPGCAERVSEKSYEYRLLNYLIPLPIDQRYSESDMQRIIDIVKK